MSKQNKQQSNQQQNSQQNQQNQPQQQQQPYIDEPRFNLTDRLLFPVDFIPQQRNVSSRLIHGISQHSALLPHGGACGLYAMRQTDYPLGIRLGLDDTLPVCLSP